jgi:hypothetical protein
MGDPLQVPVHVCLVVPLVACLRPATLVVLARHEVFEGLGLLDLAHEHGEQARPLLVHESDRVALVLVRECLERTQVRPGFEHHVVLDADRQEVRLPESPGRAREYGQSLAVWRLLLEPGLDSGRLARQRVTHGPVCPLPELLDEVLEHRPVDTTHLARGVEVQIHAEHLLPCSVEPLDLRDLLLGDHSRWFSCRPEPPTRSLPYSIGSSRGRGPSGKASSIRASSASLSRRSPAPAFSATCSGLPALGIAKSEGRRSRNRSAT